MKKKTIRRKLVNGSGERLLTWFAEDSESRLFSASEYYLDGHGANCLFTKTIMDKDVSLTLEMRITGKGGRASTGSCILDKDSIGMLVSVLSKHVTTMSTLESNDDIVTVEN